MKKHCNFMEVPVQELHAWVTWCSTKSRDSFKGCIPGGPRSQCIMNIDMIRYADVSTVYIRINMHAISGAAGGMAARGRLCACTGSL